MVMENEFFMPGRKSEPAYQLQQSNTSLFRISTTSRLQDALLRCCQHYPAFPNVSEVIPDEETIDSAVKVAGSKIADRWRR